MKIPVTIIDKEGKWIGSFDMEAHFIPRTGEAVIYKNKHLWVDTVNHHVDGKVAITVKDYSV